ncbi:hypothetical protein [Streptosporangium subroseum]|nr:hypothetical protein [Streptosporangium subroseum]
MTPGARDADEWARGCLRTAAPETGTPAPASTARAVALPGWWVL